MCHAQGLVYPRASCRSAPPVSTSGRDGSMPATPCPSSALSAAMHTARPEIPRPIAASARPAATQGLVSFAQVWHMCAGLTGCWRRDDKAMLTFNDHALGAGCHDELSAQKHGRGHLRGSPRTQPGSPTHALTWVGHPPGEPGHRHRTAPGPVLAGCAIALPARSRRGMPRHEFATGVVLLSMLIHVRGQAQVSCDA